MFFTFYHGQFVQCRETWADIETLISIKILNSCLTDQYNILQIEEIIRNNPFISVARWAMFRIKVGDLNSTTTDFLKNLKKNDLKKALKILEDKRNSVIIKYQHNRVSSEKVSWQRYVSHI